MTGCHFDQQLSTTAGKLYAYGNNEGALQYIEIGYYDDDGNAVPLAAVEVQTKEINHDVNEKVIFRRIYNPHNEEDSISEQVYESSIL